MFKLALSMVVSIGLLAPAAALACGADKGTVHKVTLDEGKELSKTKTAVFLDVNGEDTRAKMGVIAGAVLLTNYVQYDVKELPQDKDSKLVFYCANTKCGASTKAAMKALSLGYTDVAVLPEGIKGWKEAGLPTTKADARS